MKQWLKISAWMIVGTVGNTAFGGDRYEYKPPGSGGSEWARTGSAVICRRPIKCNKVICYALGNNYQGLAAIRIPNGWPNPQISVTDDMGNPLIIEGVPVQFQPDPCAPGTCEVDNSFPAPPGQRWAPFISTPIPECTVPAEVGLIVKYTWSPPPPEPVEGTTVANWYSNNGDDLYHWDVTDFYAEEVVAFTAVPVVSAWGLAVMAALMIPIASIYFKRRATLRSTA
jgi:hypothetical protein